MTKTGPMGVGAKMNTRSLCKMFVYLRLGLQLYGKNWKKIEALVVTRNGSQIRSHAQKYFLKMGAKNAFFD